MKKQAFTLMEALVTIIILSFTLMTVYRIQTNAMLRFKSWRDEIVNLYPTKENIYKSLFSKKLKIDESDDITIESEFIDISKKSSLIDFKDMIKILKSTSSIYGKDFSLITLAPVLRDSNE